MTVTLRNCSFVDPTADRVSMDVLARTTPRLGGSRPYSARALVETRDRARVTRIGVLILVISKMRRGTDVDVDWVDRVFADREGVAAFVRRMSGGRRYLDWEAFGPVELMTAQEKAELIAQGKLSEGTREAARNKGIPVDSFDHWIWMTDEGLSNAGSTSGEDSFMGAKDFTVSVATHELVHALGVDGHADARTPNDYGDGYCIMGVYQRSCINPRLATPNAPPNLTPIAGPGLSAPLAHRAGWLDLARNTVALTPGVGTRFDLYANQGAPTADDDRTVAAVAGPRPTTPEDPGQVWFEHRTSRAFDQAIDGLMPDSEVPRRPGMVHISRLVVDPEGPAVNKGDVRTFLVGAVPAVAGARAPEVGGLTPRVEAVSTEQPLVRVVLDGPARHAFLFKGDSYVRYDRLQDHMDPGYPASVAAYWPGMAGTGFASGLDAVLPWYGSKVYFFKGASYVRFDMVSNRVDAGYPLPIRGSWQGLAEAGFGAGLDAAVNWGDGWAYFFKGDKYLRFHTVANRVDLPPSPIASGWTGLGAAGFGRDIDSCVPWGNGTAYFLKGDRYLGYDMLTSGSVVGQPRAIADGWPGLATAGFGAGVKAAFLAAPPEA
jgi:hypothetical protein